MTKLQIIFIPYQGKRDVLWGADFMMQNIIKYIDKKYKIKSSWDFHKGDFSDADIVHLHNMAYTAVDKSKIFGYKSKITEFIKVMDRPKFIGGIRGYMGFERGKKFIKYFDAIHVGSSHLKEEVEKYHNKVFLCNAGIDTDLFKPMDIEQEDFSICWAGDPKKPTKNFDLLTKLGVPLKTATKENYIPHKDMPLFYNSASIYINLSSQEGFCRPIVEAAACGLPVISTNTGIAKELLQPDWIINGDPKKLNILKEFRKKILILKNDESLRVKVGKINRISSLKWSWPKIVKQFEYMFEQVYKY